MAVIDDRPFPPAAYDIVVVGSGPGGLQISYFLGRLGLRHAVLSADDAPGGTFRKWPVFERLLTWTKPDAPVPRDSRDYERYDLNSLIADQPELRALVPAQMVGTSVFPSRTEMEDGLVAFVERAGIQARYGCRWTGTRREDDRLVLETSDGEYSCRAAVFAVGVTTPWKPPIPGIEDVPHYADTAEAETYRGKSVVMIGKRNSGFELANGLLPRARRIVLLSPRHVRSDVLAAATVRVPYFQPLEDDAYGGGTIALDAAVERVERTSDGFVVHASGTTQPGPLTIHADAVIAATGFTAPLLDLPRIGVKTVARDRIPALTPFWESVSAPGVFFAGNASQGAAGLRKHGFGSLSSAVQGFRYNARVLARHLAEHVLGQQLGRPSLTREEVVPLLAHEIAHGPELWLQKGYLARAVTLNGSNSVDEGVVPLEHFLEESGPDAVAVTIETDANGTIHPVAYLRRSGKLREVALDPHPLNAFDGDEHQRELSRLLEP